MGRTVQVNQYWADRILANLNGMEYGSLNIIVHDGRIVQIERTERKRFELEPNPDPEPLRGRLKSKS